MEFKYSISILFSHMGYVFKILLWVLLCMLLTCAVGAAIIIPIGNVFAAQTDVGAQLDGVWASVDQFLSGDLSLSEFMSAGYDGLWAVAGAITGHTGAFVGFIFALIFLYMLYCFLIGLSYYPTADIVNKLMSSNLSFGFASAMAANFKTSCKFSLAKLCISFPIDVVIMLVLIGLSRGLISLIGFFALPILLAAAILLLSLRATLFSGWIPRLIFNPDEKVFTAFSRSLSSVKMNIKGMFKAYLIVFFTSYALMGGFAFSTFGLICLVIPSVYYFLLRTVELIGYYKMNGLCFYTDATTVINTVEFGYRKDNQDEEEADINY